MYCIIKFLSFLVATSGNITFSPFQRVCFSFFCITRVALDPDYGLFMGYHMSADKHEGLNACLCLLRKNVNNFAELNIRSAHHMNHRSNTEYYESTSGLVLSLPAPCLTRSE